MTNKILIIDDDPETVKLISLVLERHGFQTYSANNGIEGLSIAQNEIPDLILLDIMMPEVDGYQITRSLRNNRDTANIPILMFSAKNQVNDRVIGYEAGIDDYLTKPIHPAELVARVKSLIARTKTIDSASSKKGYMVGLISAREGFGTSTLAINLAAYLSREKKSRVIAAEMNPGKGTWSVELGYDRTNGLSSLLYQEAREIDAELLQQNLIQTSFGFKLLMATSKPSNYHLLEKRNNFPEILKYLHTSADFIIVDIGAASLFNLAELLQMFDEILVTTDYLPSSITKTKFLIEDLYQNGLTSSKMVNYILINHFRSDMQPSVLQVEEKLNKEFMQVISPAPEVAHLAIEKKQPIVLLQPDHLYTLQVSQIADLIKNRQQIEV